MPAHIINLVINLFDDMLLSGVLFRIIWQVLNEIHKEEGDRFDRKTTS